MDSAVNTFTKPYIKTAAPYLLTRAQMLYDAKKYRPAVNDFNEYETLMAAQLNAHFYFLREQAEFGGHLYQQALDDIKKAVEMAPDELVYRAEKANLELRVGMTDEAIETAKGCISKDSEASDGYLFLGLALCVKGQKTEGLQNLQKAKELGNSQAQSFIEKYSK
jgi:tetratricopeptide (TPR) repeat protein